MKMNLLSLQNFLGRIHPSWAKKLLLTLNELRQVPDSLLKVVGKQTTEVLLLPLICCILQIISINGEDRYNQTLHEYTSSQESSKMSNYSQNSGF